MATFNLSDIFRESFGYEAPKSFALPQAPQRKEQSGLGQAYYAKDYSGREFFMPVRIGGILIPFAVVGMTWRKTIVSTPMPERGGSVHEQISIDDYSFTIKGLAVNDEGQYPEDWVTYLHMLFKVNGSVEMRSALTDIVLSGTSDHRVIIRGISWPESSGVEHVKAFEIEAESDTIFELVKIPEKSKQ